MTNRLLAVAAGLVALTSPAASTYAQSPEAQPARPTRPPSGVATLEPSLIPVKSAKAFGYLSVLQPLTGPVARPLRQGLSWGGIAQIDFNQPCYGRLFDKGVGTINAATGALVFESEREVRREPWRPSDPRRTLPAAQLLSIVQQNFRKVHGTDEKVVVRVIYNGSLAASTFDGDKVWLRPLPPEYAIAYSYPGVVDPETGQGPEPVAIPLIHVVVRISKLLPGNIVGPVFCEMLLHVTTGEVLNFIFRPQMLKYLEPRYSLQEARELAVVAMMGRRPRPLLVRLLLASEVDRAESEWMAKHGTNFGEGVTLNTDQDLWLHRRPQWEFEFNYGSRTIDATTGRVLSAASAGAPDVIVPDDALFALPQPIEAPAPSKPALPETTPALEFPAVLNFNGSEEIVNKLHFPPIIRDSQPLICAEYLPAFLIKHTRAGQVIYLRGLLPKEGKTARLTLGSKHARISGQELELEAAPVEVEGRLYVPASLLQKVNGVLVRWEAKPKTLWVDTRYLRRP